MLGEWTDHAQGAQSPLLPLPRVLPVRLSHSRPPHGPCCAIRPSIAPDLCLCPGRASQASARSALRGAQPGLLFVLSCHPVSPSPQPVPGVCLLSIHLTRDDGFPKAGRRGRSRSTRILGPGPMPPRRPLGASGARAPHGTPGSRSCETASPAFLFLL